MKRTDHGRRKFFASAAFGTLAIGAYARPLGLTFSEQTISVDGGLFYRYPALADSQVSEIVGAAHGRFDKVKELVKQRPELAKASWDWGFGDFESAIGAAAHMGRRDIVRYLIDRGARPDIFAFAVLGELDVVKTIIAASPGIEKTLGPHGITLFEHARIALQRSQTDEDKKNAGKMLEFIESLPEANKPTLDLGVSEDDQKIYFGEYRWGTEDDEVFFVDLNMRKLLQIGRKGTFGRAMNRIGDHLFTPDGAASVKISFEVKNGLATALTIHEPMPTLRAERI